MKLVIAEKPSVARDVANVIGAKKFCDYYIEGNDYIVSWAIGHLVGLQSAECYDEKYKKWNLGDLPIIPSNFKYEVLSQTSKQFKNLKELANRKDVTELICSTDAGREGELIFRLIYNFLGINKPVKRLWISSMTDEAIKEGFKNLKSSAEYDNLYYSALARQQADWLVGINATRYYTLKAQSKTPLTAGRVQTPTLNLIVQRNEEIKGFQKSYYYNVNALFDTFTATYQDADNENKLSKEDAESIFEKVNNKPLTISDIKHEEKSTERPLLYDLTTLQRDANRKYGYSASQTLNIAQSLYEKHKLTTYPRTDSRYLSDDMKPVFQNLVKQLVEENVQKANDFKDLLLNPVLDSRIFDNSKISDHHAIILTNRFTKIALERLSEMELNVISLIISRILEVSLPKYKYSVETISLKSDDLLFVAHKNSIIDLGWKAIKGNEDDEVDDKTSFSDVKVGDILTPSKYEIKEIETTPPKPYTEDTLLSAMEKCKKFLENDANKEYLSNGIGTPATRASIIENLIKYEYVIRDKKNLLPTEKAINFIEICDDSLKSIEITAEWENRLDKIYKGMDNQKAFISDISSFIKTIISSATNVDISKFAPKKESLGKCPKCNRNIYEGKNSYYCEGYKSDSPCDFYIYKKIAGKSITPKIVTQLLEKGKTNIIKGFTSSKGSNFDAKLVLNNAKISFEFTNSQKSL